MGKEPIDMLEKDQRRLRTHTEVNGRIISKAALASKLIQVLVSITVTGPMVREMEKES